LISFDVFFKYDKFFDKVGILLIYMNREEK